MENIWNGLDVGVQTNEINFMLSFMLSGFRDIKSSRFSTSLV